MNHVLTGVLLAILFLAYSYTVFHTGETSARMDCAISNLNRTIDQLKESYAKH